MKVYSMDQGTEEWFACKIGIPSAGSMDKIVTPTGKKSTQYKQYMYRLAGEIMTGQYQGNTYTNPAMERGTEMEAEARQVYELRTGVTVSQIGFCVRDDELAGCSPDGLVGDDGGLEIKCPLVNTHVEYLLAGGMPTKYRSQVQTSLFVTGREWWDFMSYFPGMDPVVERITPDPVFQKMLAETLTEFQKDLTATLEQLKKGTGPSKSTQD